MDRLEPDLASFRESVAATGASRPGGVADIQAAKLATGRAPPGTR